MRELGKTFSGRSCLSLREIALPARWARTASLAEGGCSSHPAGMGLSNVKPYPLPVVAREGTSPVISDDDHLLLALSQSFSLSLSLSHSPFFSFLYTLNVLQNKAGILELDLCTLI